MKEWKGNSRSSVHAIAVNKAYNTVEREQDDFYATDPKALEALLDHCSSWLHSTFTGIQSGALRIYFSREKYIDDPEVGRIILGCHPNIWECAVGSGNLAEVLKERGYWVVCSDLKNSGYGRIGMLNRDFLKMTDDFTRRYCIGVILTNPPYSLANEFILHALEILPENGLYIALMNISYLAGKARYEQIYRYGTLREVYVFAHRINCWKNNNPDIQHGSPCNYAWYVFQKGYAGQPTLYWL